MRMMVAATLVAVCLPASAMACATPSGATTLESGMIQWINQQRQANGLNPLKPSSKLKSAAQGHACDMATRGYFSHQRAGGPDLSGRVKSNGYRFRRVAENIAKSRAADVGAAANIWRKSPPHWSNILKPGVSEIGLGVATDGGSTYWVMNIGLQR
ncbi:MAG: CAP domain-containing protein [Paracoccaceae bacterium]